MAATTSTPSPGFVTPASSQSSYANQQSILKLVQQKPASVVATSAISSQAKSSLPPVDVVSGVAGGGAFDPKRHGSEESTLIVGDLSCLRDKFRPAPTVPNADIKYLRLV